MTKEKVLAFMVKNIIFIQLAARISTYLQAYKIYKEASGKGVSIWSYVIRIGMTVMWLIYASLSGNLNSKISFTVELIGIFLVIGLVIYYNNPINQRLNYPDAIALEKDPLAVLKKHTPATYDDDNVVYVMLNNPLPVL